MRPIGVTDWGDSMDAPKFTKVERIREELDAIPARSRLSIKSGFGKLAEFSEETRKKLIDIVMKDFEHGSASLDL